MANTTACARVTGRTERRPRIRVYRRRRETEWERFCRLLKRQIRRFLRRNLAKIILFGPLIIGIIAGAFIGVKASTYAQSVKINDYGRQMVYTTYTVKSGDTIWGIAQDLAALNPEFNDIRQYTTAILKANKTINGEIKSGQIILIPYFINPDGVVSHDEIYSKYGIGE